jgi:hypothetical protein
MTATKTDQLDGSFIVIDGYIYWDENENHEYDLRPCEPPVSQKMSKTILIAILYLISLPLIGIIGISVLTCMAVRSCINLIRRVNNNIMGTGCINESDLIDYKDNFKNKTTNREDGYYTVVSGKIYREPLLPPYE